MSVSEVHSLTSFPIALDTMNHPAEDTAGDKFRRDGVCLITPESVDEISRMKAGSALAEPDGVDQRLQLG